MNKFTECHSQANNFFDGTNVASSRSSTPLVIFASAHESDTEAKVAFDTNIGSCMEARANLEGGKYKNNFLSSKGLIGYYDVDIDVDRADNDFQYGTF